MPRSREVTPPAVRAARAPTGATRQGRHDARRNAACFLLCLLTCAALVSVDARYPGDATPMSPVRAALAAVLSPVTSAGTRAAGAVAGYSDALVRPAATVAAQERLRRENAQLRAEASAAADASAVAGQVGDLLRRSGSAGLTVVPARVVAFGPGQGFERTVTLDHGTADGISSGAAVVNGDGLVGRVLVAQATSSTVLLLCDARSAVGVRIGHSGDLALARGTGICAGLVSVSRLSTDPELAAGTPVTTTGSVSESPFPPGLPVGTVTDNASPNADRGVVQVRLAAAPAALDVVGVVRR
jgi:rod shape-determining protein MreC